MQAERQMKFGAWLRRAWYAAVRTAEAMEQGPVGELFDRVDRLERDVAALKTGDRACLAAIADIADVGRARAPSHT